MSGLKRLVLSLTLATNIMTIALIGVGCTSTGEDIDTKQQQEEVVQEDTQEEEVVVEEDATEEVVEETTVEPEMFSEDGVTFPMKKYIAWNLLEKYERTGIVKVTHNDKKYDLKLDKDSIDLLKKINDKIDNGRITKINPIDADSYINMHGGFPDNATWSYIKDCYDANMSPESMVIKDLMRYDNGIL